MRVFIFPLAIVLGFIFQSCTVHSGQVVSLDYGQEVLPEDKAVGIVRMTNVLGIGGNNYDALYKEAKEQLINNRPLSQDEKYVNVNVSIKTTGFLIGYTKNYILSADVVKTATGTGYSRSHNKLADESVVKAKLRDDNELFLVSDTVMFSKSKSVLPNIPGQVVSKQGAVLTVYYLNVHGYGKYKQINSADLVRVNGKHKEYYIGYEYDKSSINAKGKVIGFGDLHLLIITDKGQKMYVPY